MPLSPGNTNDDLDLLRFVGSNRMCVELRSQGWVQYGTNAHRACPDGVPTITRFDKRATQYYCGWRYEHRQWNGAHFGLVRPPSWHEDAGQLFEAWHVGRDGRLVPLETRYRGTPWSSIYKLGEALGGPGWSERGHDRDIALGVDRAREKIEEALEKNKHHSVVRQFGMHEQVAAEREQMAHELLAQGKSVGQVHRELRDAGAALTMRRLREVAELPAVAVVARGASSDPSDPHYVPEFARGSN